MTHPMGFVTIHSQISENGVVTQQTSVFEDREAKRYLKVESRFLVVVVVQSLSRVQLFVTLWTAACQASLPCTITGHLFKFTSIESVKPSNHLILCHPLLLLPSIFPSIRIFISLLSRGLSRVFFSTTVSKHQFFSTQPSLWSSSHICT